MEPTTHNNTIKNLLYILAGLGGISLIILIHETGHFLFAKLFDVPTPVFSVGFGPTLWSFTIGTTMFKISALPIGGYVEMNPEALMQLKYMPKMLIVFGGILFNIIFAYAVLLYYIICSKMFLTPLLSSTQAMKQATSTLFTRQENNNVILGPIGIISMIGKSLAINPQLYWYILAILSLNVALINVLPIPFFDGGKALIFTIEALIGTTISPHIVWIISALCLALFMFVLMKVTINDVKRLWKQ